LPTNELNKLNENLSLSDKSLSLLIILELSSIVFIKLVFVKFDSQNKKATTKFELIIFEQSRALT
jgi:hypothetical protein